MGRPKFRCDLAAWNFVLGVVRGIMTDVIATISPVKGFDYIRKPTATEVGGLIGGRGCFFTGCNPCTGILSKAGGV